MWIFLWKATILFPSCLKLCFAMIQRELFSNCHTSAVKIRPLIATFSYLFVSGFIEHEFQIGKMITITFSQQRGRENTFQRVIQITFQNRLLLKTSKQLGKLSNFFSPTFFFLPFIFVSSVLCCHRCYYRVRNCHARGFTVWQATSAPSTSFSWISILKPQSLDTWFS